jgi:hypothetical protein
MVFVLSAAFAALAVTSSAFIAAVAAQPRADRMESVCFYLPDGKTINLPYVNPPHRGDNLEIRSALVETATRHRADVVASGKATGWEDRMVLAAMTEQWSEGGLSCTYGISRSGGRMYNCTCDAGGGGCTRVIVKEY